MNTGPSSAFRCRSRLVTISSGIQLGWIAVGDGVLGQVVARGRRIAANMRLVAPWPQR